MDLRLPGMTGAEATRAIRRHPDHRTLPIIGLTASATPAQLADARSAGMWDCVITPVEPDELIDAVKSAIASPLQPERAAAGTAVRAKRRAASASTLLRAVRFPLDMQRALARLDGNKGTYRRLLTRFLAAHRTAADVVRDAVERADAALAIAVCHPLASAAANIGALHLHRLALGLEQSLTEKGAPTPEELASFVEEHAAAMAAAKSLLETMPNESSERAPGPGQPSLAAVLSRLVQLLDQNDAAAVECLRELDGLRAEALLGADVLERLRTSIEAYDFDAARRALGEAAGTRATAETKGATRVTAERAERQE
jgi:CheY-like chemotaxis protein